MAATASEGGPIQQYLRFLEGGRFMLQRSRKSGTYFFYPRICEPGTGDQDFEWVEASGKGTVYATTVMRPRPPQSSYNVALIDLVEGPRMMARVEGVAPEDVRIGTPVQAVIFRSDHHPYVIFTPAL